MKIGWIGTGNMGVRMAKRLARAGHEMRVYNRTKEKAQPVLDAGNAHFASSPKEIARNCDVIFTSVTNDKAMDEILAGEHGLLSQVHSGQTFVEMSTLSPAYSTKLMENLHQLGLSYLNAPVVGSMFMIEQGLLKILASGDKDAYETVLPYFRDIGRSSLYLGNNAQARHMKIAVNMMICSYLTVYGEVLMAGEGMGFAWEELNEMLESSPGSSPMLNDKGTLHKQRIWGSTTALTSTAMKDLGLALDCAAEAAFPLPLTAIICQYDRYMHSHPKYESYSTFGTIGVLEDWCARSSAEIPPLSPEQKEQYPQALSAALTGTTALLTAEAALFCCKADIPWDITLDCLGTCHGASKYCKTLCASLTSGNNEDSLSIATAREGLNNVLTTAKERGLFLPILATASQELTRVASTSPLSAPLGTILLQKW